MKRCMMILAPILLAVSGGLLLVCGLDLLSVVWIRLPDGGYHWRYIAACAWAAILSAALIVAICLLNIRIVGELPQKRTIYMVQAIGGVIVLFPFWWMWESIMTHMSQLL